MTEIFSTTFTHPVNNKKLKAAVIASRLEQEDGSTLNYLNFVILGCSYSSDTAYELIADIAPYLIDKADAWLTTQRKII